MGTTVEDLISLKDGAVGACYHAVAMLTGPTKASKRSE